MTAQPDTGARPSNRAIYIALSGLMLGMLLAMLDNLIVSTALPTIVGDLGGLAHLSWVVTAYTLGTAVTTPIWGKLGDLYGRKIMFMLSIVVFMGGSALAGISQNMTDLIAFRAIQGLGAGGLMVGAMATLGDLVPPRERGRFQAMIGGMMPVAFVGGPLLGGFLTEHFSWRWTFYVNLPVGVLALLVTGFGMRLPRQRIKARIDFLGALLLGLAVVGITLVASWGGTEYEWASRQIIGLGAGGGAALIAFIVAERYVKEPLLPLRLFRNRNFTVAQLLSFMVGAAMFGAVNFLPQYMQYVQGATPTASGLLLLPLMFGMLAVLLITGQIVTRTGKYRVFPILGGLVMTAGMLVLLKLEVTTSTVMSSALTVGVGLGMGFTMQITMLITQNSVALRDMGAASGSVTLFRTLGGSLGIAVLGSIYARALEDSLVDRLGAQGHTLVAGGAKIPPSAMDRLPAVVKNALEAGVTHGVHNVFLAGAGLALVTFLVAWFIREVPLRGFNTSPAEAAEVAATPDAGLPEAQVPALQGANGLDGADSLDAPVGGAVRGFVRRGEGVPVAFAALTLIDTRGHQLGRATTRDDGGYLLTTPGPGPYVLIASATDHEPQAATLTVGDQPVDFDVVLTGSGGLVGTVCAADGAAVEDAVVVVTDARGEVVATGKTGSDGGFAFTEVVAGAYTLAVSAASYRPSAHPIEVGQSGMTRRDVILQPGTRVRGTIRVDGGGPLGDARVSLLDAAGNVVRVTITGNDGEYAFTDLTSGQYTVVATGYPPVASALTLNGQDADAHDMWLGHPPESGGLGR